jgi:Tol biopolymer transport system component
VSGKLTQAGRAAIAACALIAAWPAAAHATSLPMRTFDVSELGPPFAGESPAAADPAVSADGSVVAVDAPASGGRREIYTVDVLSGARTLISATPAGAPANGVSIAPAISADGSVVAFVSTATDLLNGTPPGAQVLYVRRGSGPVTPVTTVDTISGGGIGEPIALSADGSHIAFTTSTPLAGGDANGKPDVFVRDLRSGGITLVSRARGGGGGNGASTNPSVSSNGRYVSFDSTATDLVSGRQARAGGVFVRDVTAGRTELVSVSNTGRPQNKTVKAPFHQVSSISGNGRFVAFDSDATNLVRGDANRRTDVFVRDRKRHTTLLVSENDAGFEGNSDSFFPTMSQDGTKVAFESFASQLARGGGPRENVFVRDMSLQTTSVVDVSSTGGPLNAELVKQLLQRPAISRDGAVAAFETTAPNLTGQQGGEPHVFVRLMDAPRGRFIRRPPARTHARRVSVTLGADDRNATRFVCRIDGGTPFSCRRGRTRLPRLRPGRHVLTARAGGPGLLFDPIALRATFRVLG